MAWLQKAYYRIQGQHVQIGPNLFLNETDMEMSGPVIYYLASLKMPRKQTSLKMPRKQRRTKPGQLIKWKFS